MKNKLIILIFLFIIVIPSNVDAFISYNETFEYSNNFVDNLKNRNKYLVDVSDKYGINENGIYIDELFFKYGYLNEYEFNVTGGKKSYLYIPINFFTMTKVNDKVKYINDSSDIIKQVNVDEKKDIKIRTTHYIQTATEIVGSGTYKNPWKFKEFIDKNGPDVEFILSSNFDACEIKTYIKIRISDRSEIKENQKLYYKWIKSNETCPNSKQEYLNSDYIDIELDEDKKTSKDIIIELKGEDGNYKLCVDNGISDIYDNVSSKKESDSVCVKGMKLIVNLNGGNTEQIFEPSYNENTIIALKEPSKKGYLFREWTVNGEGASLLGERTLHCTKEATCPSSTCTKNGTKCTCSGSEWVGIGHANSLSHCISKGGSYWTSERHNCYKSVNTTTVSSVSCPSNINSILEQTTCNYYTDSSFCPDSWNDNGTTENSLKIGSGITTLEANWDLHCVKELTCASNCTQTGTTCKCTTSEWQSAGHTNSLSDCQKKVGYSSYWSSSSKTCYKSVNITTTSTLSCPTDIESTLNGTTCHAGIKDNVCPSGWTQSIE